MTLYQAVLSILGFKAHPQPSSLPSSPCTRQNISPPTAQLPPAQKKREFSRVQNGVPLWPGAQPTARCSPRL